MTVVSKFDKATGYRTPPGTPTTKHEAHRLDSPMMSEPASSIKKTPLKPGPSEPPAAATAKGSARGRGRARGGGSAEPKRGIKRSREE